MDIILAAQVLFRFRDRSFRWIDVKHFTYVVPSSDGDALAALVAHPAFRDGYTGGHYPAEAPIHGPYLLDDFAAALYRPVTLSAARECLDDFCTLDGAPTPSGLSSDIDAVLRSRLAAAAAVYTLPSGATRSHDTASVLLEFRELVTIRREPPELSLIVMGID